MKVLNFTAVEILPALLDKSKTQTIRKGYRIMGKTNDDGSVTTFPPEGIPAKYKVGEKVQIVWDNENSCSFYCSTCGKGVDLSHEFWSNEQRKYIENLHKVNFVNTGHIHDTCFGIVKGQAIYSAEFSTEVIPQLFFPKKLGEVEITEVFKIITIPNDFEKVKKDEIFQDNQVYYNAKHLALDDGFKSAEDMFKWFDKKYDLSEPREFWVYRWKWL